MRAMSLESLTTLFAVNAAGPALVAKHLLPLTPRDRPAKFAALSARVGSIGDNQLGGWYAYRASKSALNMLIRTLAIEHRRTRPMGICVALHPGTVDTALSAPFLSSVPDGKLFSPKRAAESLLAVLDSLGPDANGGFYAWDGTPIPWCGLPW
jgi:NAD(P)-dependent dehydrogenase (short-subunit alcohol dehydrogenase family)